MQAVRFRPPGNDLPGYWGPPTSSIDWCESNYVVSYYIAEFFNTISNFATLIGASFIYYNARKIKASVEFTLATIAIAIVGMGSAAFHGTLLFEAQLLDELPMVYSLIILIYSLCMNSQSRRRSLVIALALTFAAVYSAWHAFTRPVVVFHGLFILLLIVVFVLSQRHHNDDLAQIHGRTLFMVVTIGSIAVWKLDQVLCEMLEKAYLHALWHVSTAFATTIGTIGIMYSRMRYMDADEAITMTWKLGLIPFLDRVKIHSQNEPSPTVSLTPTQTAKSRMKVSSAAPFVAKSYSLRSQTRSESVKSD